MDTTRRCRQAASEERWASRARREIDAWPAEPSDAADRGKAMLRELLDDFGSR